MSLQVYLSGPITGKSFDEATNWRHDAMVELHIAGFKVRDPLRGKSFSPLSHQKKIDHKAYKAEANPTLSDKALHDRDILDVISSDILLVNFMDATQVSIGTVIEIAIGAYLNKLVVIAAPKDDKFHNHPFIRVEATVIFHTFEEALRYVISFGVEEIKRD